MERYDIAIIGTGPAGLSAAVTATIRNKKVLLLGTRDLSAKVHKAHTIKNYLGLPSVSGEDLAAAFQRHLDDMEIGITEARINAIYSMGDYFALQAGERMFEAEAVILATGVVPGKLLPGEEELLGRGVSYCATCDAPLYRGKRVAVLGYSPREESEAAFLSEVAGEVLYFPVYPEPVHLPESVKVVAQMPKAIRSDGDARQVQTEEAVYPVDGVFVLRDSISPGQLVPGLQVEGAHVAVNRQMETSIPGCFACGDIAGPPYQYIKSAGEGNVAALSAVAWLDGKKRP